MPIPVTADDEDEDADPLHFKISSALKRVIGRDLITDEFVAIFELVKNGFDARATRVDIVLNDGSLYVVDNGKGMSLRDITDKWLFVAYSAKRDGTEDLDYRDLIGSGRAFAGSKGVGRFSCDRLGQTLRMQTRRTGGEHDVEVVTVNWDRFEQNAKEEFAAVPVDHKTSNGFDLPVGVASLTSGTVLEISGLREEWDRPKLLKLRAALAKLINPFGGTSDDFQVWLYVPDEADADDNVVFRSTGDAAQTNLVNGPIENFIFDTLRGKTTHLEVAIPDDGAYIVSTLTDRGELVYQVREPNREYPLLAGTGFHCNLFYLNRSAKMTFKRRMGVNSVEFGSVFLFKNGFRIFPIGEDGVDTFGIDRRKAQGYNRFLGTRDVIGRIDVSGSDDVFLESTSRDQGLIQTPAYEQLEDCFDDKCFRRLERYVVGVNWKDQLDFDVEDASRLRGDSASSRITAIISQLAGTEGVELLDYNRDLVRILNERSDTFSDTLSNLKVLAGKSGDEALLEEINAAAARFADLQRAEIAAREAADRERTGRKEAERAATEAAARAEQATKGLEEERKRSLFLTSLGSLDRDVVEILHHQIIIHAAAINEIVNTQFDRLRDGVVPSREDLISAFENISFQNRKVLSTARFATKANFRLDSEAIEEDLAGYVVDYIHEIAPMFSETGIRMHVSSEAKQLHRRFKPIEVSILIDNLVSNAGRAGATQISFKLDQPTSHELRIIVQDDGRGFDPSIAELGRLFEKGFTTSTGSGLGLYHVAQILDDLGGAITPERFDQGARFVIRIRG
ncbi:sensor histidine kinase [uncultured Brevundimonas sp.]|uniref:sensor histidine kinase n=1 Tax=uncultured Brevundimonas sp. TaxID=213418 RepID=UPI0025E8EF48|nr:sensor histidine kinase [uncultured Brevundimonas sp.]